MDLILSRKIVLYQCHKYLGLLGLNILQVKMYFLKGLKDQLHLINTLDKYQQHS